MDCIFCKIAKKEIKAEIVYEDGDIIAFKDLHPIVPIHILIIPKKHIASVADLEDDDQKLMDALVMVAKRIAEQCGIAGDGYKLLFRVGKFGGQEIQHIHMHLLGGAMLEENIRIVQK